MISAVVPYGIPNSSLEVLMLVCIVEWRERNGRYPQVLEPGNLGFRFGNGEGFEDGKFVTRYSSLLVSVMLTSSWLGVLQKAGVFESKIGVDKQVVKFDCEVETS
jgi:hypothetical protein